MLPPSHSRYSSNKPSNSKYNKYNSSKYKHNNKPSSNSNGRMQLSRAK